MQQDKGRTEGQGPQRAGRPKSRRVSQRKELAVVTLGMVAAISGVGGLLAANPPSWATPAEPADVQQTTTAQPQAGGQGAEQDARRASEEAARQREAARQAAARAETARKESEQASGQQQAAADQYAADQAAQRAQQAAEQATAQQQQQQAAYSAQPQGPTGAVSQGS